MGCFSFSNVNVRSLLATQAEKSRLELEVHHSCGRALVVPGGFGLKAMSQQECRVERDEVGVWSATSLRDVEDAIPGGKKSTKKNLLEINGCEPREAGVTD